MSASSRFDAEGVRGSKLDGQGTGWRPDSDDRRLMKRGAPQQRLENRMSCELREALAEHTLGEGGCSELITGSLNFR